MVVFGAVVVVVRVVVVTGGVGRVVVDLMVVVVTTGATGATGAVVVTTGGEVVTGAAAVVVDAVLWCPTAFLWRAFLWCTTRLCGVTATVDVEVVDELLELPQPATSTLAAIAPSTAGRIRPTPVVAHRTSPQANNG